MERRNLLRIAVETRKKHLIQRLEAAGYSGQREDLEKMTLTELEREWERQQQFYEQEDDIG